MKSEIAKIEAHRKKAISANVNRLMRERGDLKFQQAGERAALRARWKSRDQQREKTWREHVASERLRSDYKRAASPAPEPRAQGTQDGKSPKPIKRTTDRTRTRNRTRE